jgi:uncharacterized protein
VAPAFSDLLFGSFALMLVVEGVLPFVSPMRWRAVFERAARMSNGQIRFVALASMLSGVALLAFLAP